MRATTDRWTGRARKAMIGAAAAAAVTSAALTVASPASAARGDAITPVYNMDCSTGVGYSWPTYYGYATCSGAGYWLVKTVCTAGFTYDSAPVWQMGGGTMSAQSGSCVWGVDSVRVVEIY